MEINKIKEASMEKGRILVTVRRGSIWNDFKRVRERYYRPECMLKVTFSGEPAIDTGGPKREFFAGESYILPFGLVHHGWGLAGETQFKNFQDPDLLRQLHQ